jgi:predicted nucleic acid-binding protein
MTLIIDASIAIKWMVMEADSDIADKIFESGEKNGGYEQLFAPALILLEVHYALAKLWNKKSIIFSQFAEAQILISTALNIKSVDPEIAIDAGIFSIAASQTLGASPQSRTVPFNIYDCVYISLCQRLEGTLVTADVAQAQLAKAAGCEVMLIAS